MATKQNNDVLTMLKNLSPTQFENLTFDLVVLAGLRNAQWLTPGADGGRDIEGLWPIQDFSGSTRVEHWYIECKHYSASLDWPTVYKKISYADNNHADFLLIVTSSTLSPACKRELGIWEKKYRTPKIRYWDKTTILAKISIHPYLLEKYQLVSTPIQLDDKFNALIKLMSRTIYAAYGHDIFHNAIRNQELELAGNLQVLLEKKTSEKNSTSRGFLRDSDCFEWCDIENDISMELFDAEGIRVILSAIRLVSKSERVKIIPISISECLIPQSIKVSSKLNNIFQEVTVLCDIEIFVSESEIKLCTRKEQICQK